MNCLPWYVFVNCDYFLSEVWFKTALNPNTFCFSNMEFAIDIQQPVFFTGLNMTTNVNVGIAQHAITAGRDIYIHGHVPDQTGSSGNVDKLGRTFFKFSAVTTAVKRMFYFHRVNLNERAKYESKLKRQLTQLRSQFTRTHWCQQCLLIYSKKTVFFGNTVNMWHLSGLR